MANDTVKTSRMDWRTQCLLAEANDRLDAPQEGLEAALSLQQRHVAYEFGGFRRFYDKKDPYQ